MIGAEGEERTFACVVFSTANLFNVLFTEEKTHVMFSVQ